MHRTRASHTRQPHLSDQLPTESLEYLVYSNLAAAELKLLRNDIFNLDLHLPPRLEAELGFSTSRINEPPVSRLGLCLEASPGELLVRILQDFFPKPVLPRH